MWQKPSSQQEGQYNQAQMTSRSIIKTEKQLENSFNQQQKNQAVSDSIKRANLQDATGEQILTNNNKKIGNLKVLINMRYFHISLGPDYCMFFLGFSFFSLVSLLLIYIADHSIYSGTMKTISYVIASLVPTFYLITAFSNPGIYNPDLDLQSKYKYCSICEFAISGKVRHCSKCNICVAGYDHHCPWISKCVGRGNIVAFYFFLGSTPITALYLWLSVGLFFTKR